MFYLLRISLSASKVFGDTSVLSLYNDLLSFLLLSITEMCASPWFCIVSITSSERSTLDGVSSSPWVVRNERATAVWHLTHFFELLLSQISRFAEPSVGIHVWFSFSCGTRFSKLWPVFMANLVHSVYKLIDSTADAMGKYLLRCTVFEFWICYIP